MLALCITAQAPEAARAEDRGACPLNLMDGDNSSLVDGLPDIGIVTHGMQVEVYHMSPERPLGRLVYGSLDSAMLPRSCQMQCFLVDRCKKWVSLSQVPSQKAMVDWVSSAPANVTAAHWLSQWAVVKARHAPASSH